MRLEATAKQDEYKIWMTGRELDEPRRAAASHLNDLVIQSGSCVGFRAFEVRRIRLKHARQSEDGEHHRLRAPEGKDTTGNGGKYTFFLDLAHEHSERVHLRFHRHGVRILPFGRPSPHSEFVRSPGG